MRWKVVLGLVFILAIAVVGTVAWLQWQTTQSAKRLAQTLALCRNQIEMGEHPRAQTNLEKILAENPRMRAGDEVLVLLAESYKATGAADKAAKCWERIRADFPNSRHMDRALSEAADRLYAQGKTKEAEKTWDSILARYPGGPAASGALLGKALVLYDNDDVDGARALLKKTLAERPDSPRREKMEDLLGKINLDLLYSRRQQEGDEIYAIQRGDKLETIGRRFKVSPELLERVNRIRDIRNMPVRKRLKIPKTNFSILVDKGNNTLTLLNNGEFFKRYKARTGKEDYLTPTGEFAIESKVKNPPWNNPEDGKHYPPGDPKNELGTRWMAFQGALGIHGTIHPETIGQYASNGCVGLSIADVEELYDLVPMGTTVKIIGKSNTRAKKTISR